MDISDIDLEKTLLYMESVVPDTLRILPPLNRQFDPFSEDKEIRDIFEGENYDLRFWARQKDLLVIAYDDSMKNRSGLVWLDFKNQRYGVFFAPGTSAFLGFASDNFDLGDALFKSYLKQEAMDKPDGRPVLNSSGASFAPYFIGN